jgi:hypothetical protein
MPTFREGDKVRLSKEGLNDFPQYGDSTFTVVKQGVFVNAIQDVTGENIGLYASRFEHVRTRAEGEEINFDDIRIGDEIRSELRSDDLFVTRQGVVFAIGSEYSAHSLWTNLHKRIDVDPKREAYILVKAAPEPDKVMEKLKESPEGTIVQMPNSKKTLCRKEIKNDGNKWICYFPGGQDTMTEKTFAAFIRKDFDKVVWIK